MRTGRSLLSLLRLQCIGVCMSAKLEAGAPPWCPETHPPPRLRQRPELRCSLPMSADAGISRSLGLKGTPVCGVITLVRVSEPPNKNSRADWSGEFIAAALQCTRIDSAVGRSARARHVRRLRGSWAWLWLSGGDGTAQTGVSRPLGAAPAALAWPGPT